MSGTRAASLPAVAVVAALSLAACSRSSQQGSTGSRTPRAVVATFTGVVDTVAKTMTITTIPVANPGALTVVNPNQDGQPGTGAANTFELQTGLYANVSNPSDLANGCTTGTDGFWGHVRINSFYTTQTLNNVYAQITNVLPSGYSSSGCDGQVATASVPPGASNGLGLVSYGSIPPGGSADAVWRFHNNGGAQGFTFWGEILADVTVPTHGAGQPDFDWIPSALNAPKSFVQTGTTVAHIVWDGTKFTDLVNPGLTFTSVGSPTSAFSMFPGQPYATGFVGPAFQNGYGPPYSASASYFYADPSSITGLDALLSNEGTNPNGFSVCAKFKPGKHPYWEGQSGGTGYTGPKIIFAFGQAEPWNEPVEGWALMQMHYGYCFHYHTAADFNQYVTAALAGPDSLSGDDTMDFVLQYKADGVTIPDVKAYAYDYICGGRNATGLDANSHGGGTDGQFSTYGSWAAGHFASQGSGLQFSIGGYPGQHVTPGLGGTCEGIDPVTLVTTTTTIPCTLQNQDPVCAGYNHNNTTTGYCNYGICSNDGVTPCRNGNASYMCGAGHSCTADTLTTYDAPDGINPLYDGGVYEIIIDSNPASVTNFNSIVGLAEGRQLPGSPATFKGSGDPTPIVGADGNVYTIPPYLMPPAAQDGTGLLEAGRTVTYLGPLTNSSSSGGYCVGVTARPSGAWSAVTGAFLGYDNGSGGWDATTMSMAANAFSQLTDSSPAISAPADSNEHTFRACVDPAGGLTTFDVDGAGTTTFSNAGAALDLGAATSTRLLHIGEGGGTALSGARIRRVFICPSPTASACH